MKSLRLAAAIAAALAVLAAAAPTVHAQAVPSIGPGPRPAPAEQIERKPAALDSADAASTERRDAELLYEVLLGEMNVGSGDAGTGFALLLDAARKTNDPELYKRAIEVALRAKSGDAALLAARAWKEAQPTSRDANRYVLQILVALNRVSETAEPLARELALTEPRSRAATYAAIPPLYARVTDKRAALELVQTALAGDLQKPAVPADGAAAWITVGRMRLAAGDNAGTLDAADRAQALDASAEGPAILALELMDPKEPRAEPIVQRYLNSGKPQPELRLGYARALSDAQRNTEAAQQLQRLTVEHPEFPEGWLLIGAQQVEDNQYDKAGQSVQTYLDLLRAQIPDGGKPDEIQARSQAQAYLLMSQIAEKRGDLQAAGAWLDRIDSPQALIAVQTRKAALLARQGRMAEARQLIQQIPERAPSDARLKLMAEVQLLRDNNQQQQAYTLLAQGLTKTPEDADLRYDLAMSAEKLGRPDEMERLLRQVIEQKPDYYHAYNALGYSLADRGQRLPEARELIKKALEFAPNDPFITDSLGWVEFRAGNREEAARILEGAFKARPDPEIAAHLGEVLWSLGRQDQAKSIWKQGLQLNSQNDTLLQTLKRLRVTP
ncbi:tetratricopeptide repeat protein [Xylophilus sp. GW821-FHT01B05]